MVDYNERSSEEAVIRHFERISGPSLTQFENSLRNINTYYKLIGKKKSRSETRKTIEYLESSKEELVKTIDRFINKSYSWEWIKNTHPDIDELDIETKAEFIRTKFQLQYYFEFVDQRIARLNRIIHLVHSVHFHTEDKRKRIQLHTLALLVWLLAFKNKGLSNRNCFTEIKALLTWFSRNRSELFPGYIGRQIHISKATIKRAYERYIQNPTSETESYKELAELIYSQTFLENDVESLI